MGKVNFCAETDLLICHRGAVKTSDVLAVVEIGGLPKSIAMPDANFPSGVIS